MLVIWSLSHLSGAYVHKRLVPLHSLLLWHHCMCLTPCDCGSNLPSGVGLNHHMVIIFATIPSTLQMWRLSPWWGNMHARARTHSATAPALFPAKRCPSNLVQFAWMFHSSFLCRSDSSLIKCQERRYFVNRKCHMISHLSVHCHHHHHRSQSNLFAFKNTSNKSYLNCIRPLT